MKKVFALVFIFCLYYVFSEELSDMVVYSYTPITDAISTVYEIDFYEDGLIKEIREYINPQDRTKSSEELNKLDDIKLRKIKHIVRNDDRISVYHKEKINTETGLLLEYYELLSSSQINRVKIDDSNTSREIAVDDVYGSITYFYKGKESFNIKQNDSRTTWEYPNLNKVLQYNTNEFGILDEVNGRKDDRRWTLDISLNNHRTYTCIKYEDEVFPYLSKIEIKVINEFSLTPMSRIINAFILPSDQSDSLMPFLVKDISYSNEVKINKNKAILSSGVYIASSYLTEGQTRYLPDNLGVSVFAHPWVEGVSGSGIGETITIGRDEPFSNLILSNGYHSHDKPYLFEKNGRVKEIKIEGKESGFLYEISLEDNTEPQIIELPKTDSEVTITILDVYPGSQWDDTSINYILVR